MITLNWITRTEPFLFAICIVCTMSRANCFGTVSYDDIYFVGKYVDLNSSIEVNFIKNLLFPLVIKDFKIL